MSVRSLIMAAAGAAPVALPYRYWRIYITALNSGGTQAALYEIELRGTVGGADLTGPSTPVLASSYFDDGEGTFYPGSATVDNNVSSPFSIWLSNGTFPHWVRYDLATAQAVVQVAIKPYENGTQCPRDFKIQGSTNGTTFVDVKSFTGVAAWTDWQSFNLN